MKSNAHKLLTFSESWENIKDVDVPDKKQQLIKLLGKKFYLNFSSHIFFRVKNNRLYTVVLIVLYESYENTSFNSLANLVVRLLQLVERIFNKIGPKINNLTILFCRKE